MNKKTCAISVGLLILACSKSALAAPSEKLPANLIRYDCAILMHTVNIHTGENESLHFLVGFANEEKTNDFQIIGAAPLLEGQPLFYKYNKVLAPFSTGKFTMETYPVGVDQHATNLTINTATGMISYYNKYVYRYSGSVPVYNITTLKGHCERNLTYDNLPDVDIQTGAVIGYGKTY